MVEQLLRRTLGPFDDERWQLRLLSLAILNVGFMVAIGLVAGFSQGKPWNGALGGLMMSPLSFLISVQFVRASSPWVRTVEQSRKVVPAKKPLAWVSLWETAEIFVVSLIASSLFWFVLGHRFPGRLRSQRSR